MDDFSAIAPTVASSGSRRQLKSLPAPIARTTGDASPPLVCRRVFDSISIHANGDIVCWDVDVNAKHVYGNVFTDRIAAVYNGPKYREIREWMLRSRPDTWCPAVNYHCPLRVIPATTNLNTDNCHIKHLQLESTTYCNLRVQCALSKRALSKFQQLRETRAQKFSPRNNAGCSGPTP